MFEQLDTLIFRFEEILELLSDPSVIADTNRLRELTIEESDLRPKVEKIRRYKQVEQELADTEEMLNEGLDAEMAEMAKMELAELKEERETLQEEIKIMMLPEDPNDGVFTTLISPSNP